MSELAISDTLPANEEKITDERAIDAYHALGFVEMKSRQVIALRELGLHIRQSGILRQQCGTAMFNQQALIEAMNLVKVVLDYHAKLPKSGSHTSTKKMIEKMEQLTKMLCLLSAKLSESQEIMIKLGGGEASHGGGNVLPDKLNRTFAPGSQVQPGGTLVLAQNVQINGAKKEA